MVESPEYVVPDMPYDPEELKRLENQKRDKLEGFRSLTPDQYNAWLAHIEEASE